MDTSLQYWVNCLIIHTTFNQSLSMNICIKPNRMRTTRTRISRGNFETLNLFHSFIFIQFKSQAFTMCSSFSIQKQSCSTFNRIACCKLTIIRKWKCVSLPINFSFVSFHVLYLQRLVEERVVVYYCKIVDKQEERKIFTHLKV